MKPSERIETLSKAILAEIRGQLDDRDFDPVAATAGVQALVDYLDEQHETERRRIALWTALALIGPGATAERINGLLEKAGLGTSVAVFPHERFETAKEWIVDAAEKAGLI